MRKSIYLFCQVFLSHSDERNRELITSFLRNVSNPYIKTIIAFYESEEARQKYTKILELSLKDQHSLQIEKILWILKEERLTYSDWLVETNKLPNNSISILANLDVYFDNSIRLLNKIKLTHLDKFFLPITRHNYHDSELKLNSNPHWCQDAWVIFKSTSKLPENLIQDTRIELGYPGCDNRISYIFQSYGYWISNPCKFICLTHMHASDARAYHKKKNKSLGIYCFVHPAESLLSPSILEFELWTLNSTDIQKIKINEWMTDQKISKDTMLTRRGLDSFEHNLTVQKNPTQFFAGIDRSNIFSSEFEKLLEENKKKLGNAKQLNFNTINFENYRSIGFFPSGLEILNSGNEFVLKDSDNETIYVKNIDISQEKGALSKHRIYREFFWDRELDLNPFVITDDFSSKLDFLFWQSPAISEKVYSDNKWIERLLSLNDGEHFLNLRLPWATIIDKKMGAHEFFDFLESKIKNAISSAPKRYRPRVVTFCQHYRWRELIPLWKKLGVTDVISAHKIRNEDVVESIKIHPGLLYPVNALNPKFSEGFERKDIKDRKLLFSFIGAYKPHYMNDVRLKLKEFENNPGGLIEIKDEWHFNETVYRGQVRADQSIYQKVNVSDTLRYNQVLSDSVFALCPSGAGPNSIRFWEALYNGTIPVLISDKLELPDLRALSVKDIKWDEICIFLPESKVIDCDKILSKISNQKKTRMQNKLLVIGQNIFSSNMTSVFLSDHEVFSRFDYKKLYSDGKNIIDAFGVKTDPNFKKGWNKHVRPIETLIPIKPPPKNENYFDWVITLQSVLSAKHSYTAVELGAGYAPWSVLGGVLARDSLHIDDINLLALEADDAHAEYSKIHFNNNKFNNPEKHKVILGAIAGQSGEIKFPLVEDPQSDYGASIYNKSYSEYRSVMGYSLAELFQMIPEKIDLLHVDAQGAEYDIFTKTTLTLLQNVRYIVISTHFNEQKHNELVTLLKNIKTHEILYEFKPKTIKKTEFGDIKFGDGFIALAPSEYK